MYQVQRLFDKNPSLVDEFQVPGPYGVGSCNYIL